MGQAPTNDVSEIDAVQREVDALRERTQALVVELDRRLGVGVARARRGAAATLALAVGAALGVGLYALWARRAHRRTQRGWRARLRSSF
jgi:hypothetical protein